MKVEWDGYCKNAWYELHKSHKGQIALSTKAGAVRVDAHVISHNDDALRSVGTPSVSVGLNYGGKEIWGYGNDCFWTDAFAALQKKLPNDVKIQCCMTCRHGNMCPVGNIPGEIFCTKDVVITQKSDLYFYTEDERERKARSRKCTDICEAYGEQSEEYYTYNDYLYYLK